MRTNGIVRALVARGLLLGSVLLPATVWAGAAGEGEPCAPGWLAPFGGPPGANSNVRALVTFDDGDGPRLHVAGGFWQIENVEANRVARWTGTRWEPLGAGLVGNYVAALAVFDDGGGPALYAGGSFSLAVGQPAVNVARWDGTSWSAVGGGIDGPVGSLLVFDDGGGPALYAGGDFLLAGNTGAARIARWDGRAWSALGSGTNGAVDALAVHAGALYAGGSFSIAGGVPASRVARWDGSTWSALGGGTDFSVSSLASFEGALVASGFFTTAGGLPASHIARWDGATWSTLGDGLSAPASSLFVFDDGAPSGPALFAGGDFTSAGGLLARHVARWDGDAWSALAAGVSSDVFVLGAYTDPVAGPLLCAGGIFDTSPEPFPHQVEMENLGTWDGSRWAPISMVLDAEVRALAVYDDGLGGGPALYAAGEFVDGGLRELNGVGRWDEALGWTPLGDGVDDAVFALEAHDDGSGAALYAGGWFVNAGGLPSPGIARWDGLDWSSLGGAGGVVRALASFDAGDGNGPQLYAGGNFLSMGGVAASYVARWDGATWWPLGSGVDGVVLALEVFDDGGGPALYAGGQFTTAGGSAAAAIARWDGLQWSALAGGTNGPVYALAAGAPAGQAPALFVGGEFSLAGGVSAARLARWSGTSWSSLGAQMDQAVWALAFFDDGAGRALYAGGAFTQAAGQPAQRIGRWDGQGWSAPAEGLSHEVFALAAYDGGAAQGSTLYAAGRFRDLPGFEHVRFARWAGCKGPWLDLGGGTTGQAGPPTLELAGALTPSSLLGLDLVAGAPGTLALVFLSFTSTPTSFLGGTLHAFPFAELLVLGTDGSGSIHGSVVFPGAASGTGLWFQVGLADPAVPLHGASLSNGVVGTVP